MTLIAAAALTIIVLAHPEPIALRSVLVLAVGTFSAVVVAAYGTAFMRFFCVKVRSERDALFAVDGAQEDVALCFFLNGFFGSCPLIVLRLVLLGLVFSVMLVSVACTAHEMHAVLVSTALLFLLALQPAADLMHPAEAGLVDYKHFQIAIQRRGCVDASSFEARAASAKCTPGLGLGLRLSSLRALLSPTASRVVVLEESAKLARADLEGAPAAAHAVYGVPASLEDKA